MNASMMLLSSVVFGVVGRGQESTEAGRPTLPVLSELLTGLAWVAVLSGDALIF
jgi:hypothetical protein